MVHCSLATPGNACRGRMGALVKIVELETFVVSVPYTHQEVSSRVYRGGVTDVLVKLTADNGDRKSVV